MRNQRRIADSIQWKWTQLFLVVALMGSLPSIAKAAEMGRKDLEMDTRQANQAERIEQGSATGQLSPHEQSVLNRQQRRIQAVEGSAEADGNVSPAEKARIERVQNRASRKIYRLKHNRHVR